MSPIVCGSVAAALLLVGCTAPAGEGGAARTAAPVRFEATRGHAEQVRLPQAPAFTSLTAPFHVALVEAERKAGAPVHRVVPCGVRGRVLLCTGGAPLVSTDDGVETDEGLAAATGKDVTGEGSVEVRDVVGRWPDDAWMLTYARGGPSKRRAAFAWHDGRWVRRAAWDGAPRFAARWRDGLVVDAAQDADDERGPHERDRPPLSFVGPGDVRAEAPALPGRVAGVAGTYPSWPRIDHALGVDGELFAVVESERPSGVLAMRWTQEGGRGAAYELAPRAGMAHLWAGSSRDVVAFGGATNADDSPLLAWFDGQRWTPMPAPPDVDLISAYARSKGGTERIFALRGEELSLWERSPGSSWQRQPLPALRSGESIDGRWLTEDDAWLRVRASDGRGRLLRTRPVKHVYYVGGTPPVEAVDPADAPLAAAMAPVPPEPGSSPPDPASPFRDAVLGCLDSPDATAPGSLTLCPVRGRTFVCGMTETPLVSTDDGVVRDEPAEARLAAGKGMAVPGRVIRSFGSWPDDVWVVTATLGSSEVSVQRRAGDAWAPFASWEGSTAQVVGRAGTSLLVAPFQVGRRDGVSSFALGRVRDGRRGLEVASTRIAPAREGSSVQVRDLASVEDALFVVATRGRTVEVERRLADGVKGVRVDAMAGFDGRSDASVDVSLWVRSPDDAVLFGGVGLAPATPVLRRFDGQGWSVMDTPPGVDRVVAYDRSNVGTERVFARQGEVLGLFERAAEPPVGGSREWARVPLPALGRGATVRGAWLANDDAWLLVWPPDTTIQPPRLMRMKPVVRVWTCPRRLPDDVGW